jgi:predicted nucleic acid-binding protein
VRTAVDTSVLLDVLTADEAFGRASREALRKAYDTGGLVASDVVWAEVRANFAADEPFETAMGALGVAFEPTRADAARLAGRLWRERTRAAQKHGAKARQAKRVVADLLVGAHALLQADVLLARDRGFYRGYFKGLRVIDPSEGE